MEAKKPNHILQTLHRRGYEAYYVGGCVRDQLLGRPVHDWDITTSALPEQIISCFGHSVPTGLRHGTVTVLEGESRAEVTTYRTEEGYADGRHPDRVRFVRSLGEDLARRDFTINAMAMDENGGVIDLFGGRNDLTRRVIRCVGEPERRFQEDALRMLRAIRFSAQLDFSIEENTRMAIRRNAHRCTRLSAERVRDEMEKTLLSPHPERLNDMLCLGLLDGFVQGATGEHAVSSRLPEDRAIRWAALCRCWPTLDLTRLRLDRRTTGDAMTAASLQVPTTRLGWKRLLSAKGEQIAHILAALEGKTALLDEILTSGECVTLKQLAVRGSDFPDLHGPALGVHLHRLLQYVLEHPEENRRERLIELTTEELPSVTDLFEK